MTSRKSLLKSGVQTVRKRRLHYIVGPGGGVVRFKPWLGDASSFLYDIFMKSSVFPKKFRADFDRHAEILCREMKDIHGQSVLELGTGNGSAAGFLPGDNRYTGTDISPGLLKRAVKAFEAAGFENAGFYVTGSESLPFDDGLFSVCLCILTMNFFGDAGEVMREVARVMAPGGRLICSVPVPERCADDCNIRGTLRSQRELKGLCEESGFAFEGIPDENGALLYFRAILRG